MYILHLETSTKVCSVALSRDIDILKVVEVEEGMNHTAMLVPMIRRLLGEFSISPLDIGAISVSSGPGSYTGLRVGSSAAKAFSYSLQKPLIAVTTLEALAIAAFDKHPDLDYVLPLIDARRNEVYTALYNKELKELIPTSSLILDTEGIMKILPGKGKIGVCGDGAAKWPVNELPVEVLVDTQLICSARHLVKPAIKMLEKGKLSDPLHFVPFYLKPPNITQPKLIW